MSDQDLIEVEALSERTDASDNTPRSKGERFFMPRARAERGVRIGWLKMVGKSEDVAAEEPVGGSEKKAPKARGKGRK